MGCILLAQMSFPFDEFCNTNTAHLINVTSFHNETQFIQATKLCNDRMLLKSVNSQKLVNWRWFDSDRFKCKSSFLF